MKSIFTLPIIFFAMTTLTHAQLNDKDKTALRTMVQTLEDGWFAKNGKTFASQFAPTHDYIVWNGLYMSNITPEQNAMAHQGIFDTQYKYTDLKLRVDKMKSIRPDLALVHVLGATYERGKAVPSDPRVIITLVVEKQNDVWKIISFHNCDIEISFDPEAQGNGPVPPRAMFGSWYSDSGK